MKTVTIEIENLKCGGCENTINKELSKIDGVIKTVVDSTTATVYIQFDEPANEAAFYKRLAQLGYPEKGTGNAYQKAKSYVSCAVGKIGS